MSLPRRALIFALPASALGLAKKHDIRAALRYAEYLRGILLERNRWCKEHADWGKMRRALESGAQVVTIRGCCAERTSDDRLYHRYCVVAENLIQMDYETDNERLDLLVTQQEATARIR